MDIITRAKIKPRAYRSKVVFLGDSLTLGGLPAQTCFPTWVQMLTNLTVINKGVAGNKTTDLISRLSADVIANNPAVCVILIGTNDAGSLTLAQYCTNIKSITASLVAANIWPVYCTVPVNNVTPANNYLFRQMNNFLVAHCQAQGLGLIDVYSIFAKSDGTVNTALIQGDNLHPNELGAYLIAQLVIKYLPAVDYSLPTSWAGDAENLFPNGSLVDSNSDGVPDSWTTSGDAGCYTCTTLNGVATFSKNNTGANAYFSCYTSSALTVGNTYRFEATISYTNPSSTNLPPLLCEISHTGASTTNFFQSTGINIGSMRLRYDFTVPSSTTASRIIFALGGSLMPCVLTVTKPKIVLLGAVP